MNEITVELIGCWQDVDGYNYNIYFKKWVRH